MNRHCYTLVELMVVIAIAALLLSLGMPAFRGMIEGNGAGYTASTVKGVIDQTRSKGLSLRRYTAILFDLKAERGVREGDGSLDLRQAVRGCIVEKRGTNYPFVEWIPDREWLVLDRGGWILGVADNAKFKRGTAEASALTDEPTLENIIDKIKEMVDERSNPNEKVMTKVRVPEDADPNAVDDHEYYALIFSPYGAMEQPKKRPYILVGEGKIRGNMLRYAATVDDKDKVPLNSLVLSINPFTGRVETRPYGEDDEDED